jgi:hypothetical protein
MRWLRFVVLMWLLVRIDDNWDLVIIGGYDTEQNCRMEQERSLWGSRVFCAPAKVRTDASVTQSRGCPREGPCTPPSSRSRPAC